MILIESRALRHAHDGKVMTFYECQACLYSSHYVMETGVVPKHISCPQCGWNERNGRNES